MTIPPSFPPTGADDAAPDVFRTITAPAAAELKIQGSRFLAHAAPAATPDEAAALVDALRRRFHDATHHCSAWRLGTDADSFRFNDDGEPTGTAGRRILTAIDRRRLTDTAIVVVRYFGGVKLGVGGLARAYSDAADAALDAATIERRFLFDTFRIAFPYDQTSQVHHVLESMHADILERDWSDAASYLIRIRRSHAAALRGRLADATDRTIAITP